MGTGSSAMSKTAPSVQTTTVEDLNLSRKSSVEAVARKTEEKKYENMYIDLEKQLGGLEVVNLDLQDKIQILEDQLQYYTNRHEEAAYANVQEDYTETVKAKDHIIENLNSQINKLQEDMRKLKIRHKKKLKATKSQMSETQQGNTLKAFELNSEISRLRTENEKMLVKINAFDDEFPNHSLTVVSPSSKTSDDLADPRNTLILELSNQISQQDARIVELEKRISEKDEMIAHLQSKGQAMVKSNANHDDDDNWEASGNGDNGRESVNSNIRQISAMKKRQKHKDIDALLSQFDINDTVHL